MSAEHKRPLFAFVLVTLACMLVMGHAIRSDALSRTIRVAIPTVIAAGVHLVPDISPPASVQAQVPAPREPVAQPKQAEVSEPVERARAPRPQMKPQSRDKGIGAPSGGLALTVPPQAPQSSSPAPVAPNLGSPAPGTGSTSPGSTSPGRGRGPERPSYPQPAPGYGAYGGGAVSAGSAPGDRGRGYGRGPGSHGYGSHGSSGYASSGYGYGTHGYGGRDNHDRGNAGHPGRGYGYGHSNGGPSHGHGYGYDSGGRGRSHHR
ncbi:hypothetical protein [Nocardioides pacificus]